MNSPQPADRPRLGLALGGGAARGWSHLGVLEELAAMGVKPDLIAGCSIGSVVGAFYAEGKLEDLRAFAEELTVLKMIDFLDLTFKSGGVIHGNKVIKWIEAELGEITIEDLSLPFGAVAADIRTGGEVWMRQGPVAQAIRASIAIPGLLTPWPLHGRWLTDGGLVNPVPVSLARAMGAEVVIAVDINGGAFRFFDDTAGDLVPADPAPTPEPTPPNWLDELADHLPGGLKESTRKMVRDMLREKDRGPQQYEVIVNAISVMSTRITRARAAMDPADVMIAPDLASINVTQFYKAKEAIEAGREATRRLAPQIEAAIGFSAPKALDQ
jgi:NTE family protein